MQITIMGCKKMIKRIDADTIEVITSKFLKISDLKNLLNQLEESNIKASEDEEWRNSLPEDKKSLVPLLPDFADEIEKLEKRISDYESLKIGAKVKEAD